jgi:segregation and condensation protein B
MAEREIAHIDERSGEDDKRGWTEPLGLEALVESLLFVASGPVEHRRLATALDVSVAEIEAALAELERLYENRGLRLQHVRARVQLTTAARAAPYVERFLGLESKSRLSLAALETLAIIAYRQPVTRPEIDAVRGVNSDGVMRTLLSKGLIEELARAEGPGRPIQYGTTFTFLQHFGLTSVEELPALTSSSPP